MKSRYYDLQYIKAIPIADYLHACGIEPAKRMQRFGLERGVHGSEAKLRTTMEYYKEILKSKKQNSQPR